MDNPVFVFNIRIEFDDLVDTDPKSEDVIEITDNILDALVQADDQGLLCSNTAHVNMEVVFVGCVPAAVPDETYTPRESEDDNG